MPQRLAILGLGVDLPPSVDVVEHAASLGADTSLYKGWRRTGRARPDDHPSTMGQRALSSAIEAAGIRASDIDLVISTGTSRDYPPSWSLSTELIELCDIGPWAIGMDLMAGCLSTLAGLEFTQGYLAQRGGGHAAVVTAERWTTTVDYSDASLTGIWGYGDGAAAAVVGVGSSRPSLFDLVGVHYRNAASNNGHVRMAYGGTRAPIAPPGVDPNARILAKSPRNYILDLYRQGFADAIGGLRKRFDLEATHLVANQTSPGVVAMVAQEFGLENHVTMTGHESGHVGGADIFIGMDKLIRSGEHHEVIAASASAAYGFAAALFAHPSRATLHDQAGDGR